MSHQTSLNHHRSILMFTILLLITSSSILVPAVEAMGSGNLRSPAGYGGSVGGERCEKITIPLCADMKYNMTRMPNLIGHTSQKEALQVHEFIPLIQFGCSRLLKFFLCSVYVPMCTEQVDEVLVIPACRSMCVEVRSACEPILKRFNFPWPSVLDCSNLPEKKDHQTLCMEAPSGGLADELFGQEGNGYGSVDLPGEAGGGLLSGSPNYAELMEEFRRGGDGSIGGGRGSAGGSGYAMGGKDRAGAGGKGAWSRDNSPSSSSSIPCGDRFIMIERLVERGGPDSYCAPRCDMEVLFRAEDKRFAFIWTTVWAGCSLFAAILTVLTFFADTSRFPYPERPIIYLALCFIPLSSAYLLRVGLRAETLSCNRVRMENGEPGQPFVVQDGFDNIWCVVDFALTYYFQMASAVWWLTLSVTWFLAAARKWGAEAIARLGCYFHVVAWAVPAVQTTVVLALRRVDGDELLGTCYVGNRNWQSRLALVIVPLLAYLVLGSIFILAGFVAMLRIRADLRRHEPMLAASQGGGGGGCQGSIRKLEKLMAKIGLFAVLYALPAACVVGVHIYEQLYQDEWLKRARHTSCETPAASRGEIVIATPASSSSEPQCQPLIRSIPSVELFMLRHFMTLVVGITSGMWVWSAKTCRTWRNFCGTSSKGAGRGGAGKRKSPTASRPAAAAAPAGPSGALTVSSLGGYRAGSLKGGPGPAAPNEGASCSYLRCPTGPTAHLSPLDRMKLASR